MPSTFESIVACIRQFLICIGCIEGTDMDAAARKIQLQKRPTKPFDMVNVEERSFGGIDDESSISDLSPAVRTLHQEIYSVANFDRGERNVLTEKPYARESESSPDDDSDEYGVSGSEEESFEVVYAQQR